MKHAKSTAEAVRGEGSPGPVSSKPLIRLSGQALLLGGVLWGLGETAWGIFVLGAEDPSEYPQPLATILWVVVLVGFIFMMLGLPGLHAVHAVRNARLSLVGLVVLFAGAVLLAGLAYFGAFLQAAVADLIVEAEEAGLDVVEPASEMIGYLGAYGLFCLGWVLFGVANLRARILPRWPMVLTMVGSLLMLLVGLPLVTVVGVVWLGVAMIRLGRSTTSPVPATS